MGYTKTLLKYYEHIALAAVDVSTYVTTLEIVKNNLNKIIDEQTKANIEEPVDKESLLFLRLLLSRYEKFLTGLVATRPHLIITSRYTIFHFLTSFFPIHKVLVDMSQVQKTKFGPV